MDIKKLENWENLRRIFSLLVGFYVLYVGYFMVVRPDQWPEGHPWIGIFFVLLAFSQLSSALPKDLLTPKRQLVISLALSVGMIIDGIFVAVSLHK